MVRSNPSTINTVGRMHKSKNTTLSQNRSRDWHPSMQKTQITYIHVRCHLVFMEVTKK